MFSKFNVVTHSSDFKHCPLRCDPNRGQRRQHVAAASPRCDPMRGQRGKPSLMVSPACALKVTRHSPVVAGAGTSRGHSMRDPASSSTLPSTSPSGAGCPVIGSSSLAVESVSVQSRGPASSSSCRGRVRVVLAALCLGMAPAFLLRLRRRAKEALEDV